MDQKSLSIIHNLRISKKNLRISNILNDLFNTSVSFIILNSFQIKIVKLLLPPWFHPTFSIQSFNIEHVQFIIYIQINRMMLIYKSFNFSILNLIWKHNFCCSKFCFGWIFSLFICFLFCKKCFVLSVSKIKFLDIL